MAHHSSLKVNQSNLDSDKGLDEDNVDGNGGGQGRFVGGTGDLVKLEDSRLILGQLSICKFKGPSINIRSIKDISQDTVNLFCNLSNVLVPFQNTYMKLFFNINNYPVTKHKQNHLQ